MFLLATVHSSGSESASTRCPPTAHPQVRVTTVGPGERTYHSFYQMLAGASDAEREAWQLRGAPDYRALSQVRPLAAAPCVHGLGTPAPLPAPCLLCSRTASRCASSPTRRTTAH